MSDAIMPYLKFLEEALRVIVWALTDEGTVIIGKDNPATQRKVHYITKPKSHGFPPQLRYYCKVTDLQTGIKARADNYKSKEGAREHAVENLANKLREQGLLK